MIMAMLEQKLPTYVVNYFAATGFDGIESIRERDIRSGKSCPIFTLMLVKNYSKNSLST